MPFACKQTCYSINSAFRLTTDDGVLALCSEAKGLTEFAERYTSKIQPVQPGTVRIYSLDVDGKATLSTETRFHTPGTAPKHTSSISDYVECIKPKAHYSLF